MKQITMSGTLVISIKETVAVAHTGVTLTTAPTLWLKQQ